MDRVAGAGGNLGADLAAFDQPEGHSLAYRRLGAGAAIGFALLMLRFDAGERALAAAGDAVNRMLAYAFVGSGFVFGELGKQHSSYRSFTIATFALCGFANLSSIGMQIGGIGALAPNRRNDLARLGLRQCWQGLWRL